MHIKGDKFFLGYMSAGSKFFFLEEVYSSRDLERVWSAEWGGKVVYSHGTKHNSGTLIFFYPSLDVEVENYETDQKG